MVHDSLEDGGFRQSEGFVTLLVTKANHLNKQDYNKRLKNQIITEIYSMPDCKFNKEQVKGACIKNVHCVLTLSINRP